MKRGENLEAWKRDNPEREAVNRAKSVAALDEYRRNHPNRLRELQDEGHEYWRRNNPDAFRRARLAGNEASRRKHEPSREQLRRVVSLRRRHKSWRQIGYMMGIGHVTAWRWHLKATGAPPDTWRAVALGVHRRRPARIAKCKP